MLAIFLKLYILFLVNEFKFSFPLQISDGFNDALIP
jgi:hypothetical protein